VINKADASIMVNGYTGTYDGLPHGATGTAYGVGGVDLSSGLNLGVTFTNAPGGSAHWTFSGGTNYKDQSGDAAIVINKATLTVTAVDMGKLLNASNPTFTFQINGFKFGETASILITQPICTSTAETNSPVGSYAIICTGATADNYSFNYIVGKLSITYRFDGFLQPINDTAHTQLCGPVCPISIFKGGSTIPVKFQLKDANGVVVQTSLAPLWLSPVLGGQTTAPVDETTYFDLPTNGATYSWDGQQYHYNWSTKGFKAGYYYRIGFKLTDGTTNYVYIGLR
ncbi:MAG TPA: PxKF domain-containing protein, partial [Anaerolineales bacterium]